MKSIELRIDVTEAAALGRPMQTAVTVFMPQGELTNPPVVCFAFPGGGYCRRYYSFDMPDGSGGGQAGYHCDRGWIFVACDHLGFGDSTVPEGNALDYENIARANDATVKAVMQKLAGGTLREDCPPVRGAATLGIGQSMGGCFTIVAQAQLETFDAIGVLGYSGIHTIVPSRPGAPAAVWPWVLRASPLDNPKILNRSALAAAAGPKLGAQSELAAAAAGGEHPFAWCFHYDDEPADIVALDMRAASGVGALPAWRSATTPPCGLYMVAPGTVSTEAASITVPVLIAVGERDVVPDPWMEPKAFKSSSDVTVFVCPRMGHMHNFAHTRREFWQRIHAWGAGVADMKVLRCASA
ncbi:MAG TPA: alpha/beta hydrolase [Steroidobacteraceae bacterium]|jgi:pimeloyl-ACP methyl ester carboxylesterase